MAARVHAIDDVPDECLELVLGFLNLRDVGQVRRACKRFHRLTSFAWNAAQTPAGRLRAVSAAPAGLVRWALAGIGDGKIVVDDRCVLAVWREEIRALLAAAPVNILRTDIMPAGAFWEPRRTLYGCLRDDSAEGLAFLVDRGVIGEADWPMLLECCLQEKCMRIFAYICEHSGLDPAVVHKIAASTPLSMDTYTRIAERFPLPETVTDLWFHALGQSNMTALRWLGCTPELLYTNTIASKTNRKLFRTAVFRMKTSNMSQEMALWLREVLQKDVALTGKLCKKVRSSPTHAFGLFLQMGQLEQAQLIVDFSLEPDFIRDWAFVNIARCAFFAGHACAILSEGTILGEIPPAKIVQAETAFEWFNVRFLVPLSAHDRQSLCSQLLRRLLRIGFADTVHARFERVFGDTLHALLLSQDLLQNVQVDTELIAAYQNWRARAYAVSPAKAFAREREVISFSHDKVYASEKKRPCRVHSPNAAILITAARYAGRPNEEFDFFSRDEFGSLLKNILLFVGNHGLPTLFLAAPALAREWLDAIDISCERSAVRSFLDNAVICMAEALLRVGNFRTPAAWLQKGLEPSQGFLYAAIARVRSFFGNERPAGASGQPEGVPVAACCRRLLAAAGAFLPEVTRAVLSAAVADLEKTDLFSLELLKTAYETCADFLRALMQTNPAFTAAVIHACTVPETMSVRLPVVFSWEYRDIADILLREAWAACKPADLVAACMDRLAAPRTNRSKSRLNRALAKMLCVHGADIQKLAATNQSPLNYDIAGFFARHHIPVALDVLSGYLAYPSRQDRLRKFVRYALWCGYSPEHAVEIAASIRDVYGELLFNEDTQSALGPMPVPAKVLAKIAHCVAAGCDCDGWPAGAN